MADGKQWMTENLDVNAEGSLCYGDAEPNCQRYGRLYTWEAARRSCQSLGGGWRLPTDDEWRQMAKHYGGLREDSADGGKGAYAALSSGGTAGFNALFGGGFIPAEGYARIDAHGLYWSASESSPDAAWFYNFGKGGLSVSRHRAGNKQIAISVRCIQ